MNDSGIFTVYRGEESLSSWEVVEEILCLGGVVGGALSWPYHYHVLIVPLLVMCLGISWMSFSILTLFSPSSSLILVSLARLYVPLMYQSICHSSALDTEVICQSLPTTPSQLLTQEVIPVSFLRTSFLYLGN